MDVEGWAEFTYQSLVRARTVYLGYYIDLEKMDDDLEEVCLQLCHLRLTTSRVYILSEMYQLRRKCDDKLFVAFPSCSM